MYTINNKLFFRFLFLIFISVSLASCSSAKKKKDVSTIKGNAIQLLKEARVSMNGNDYEQAIKKYESLEAKFPLGRFAQQALLEQAYAYYKFDEPDTALDTIDRYMRVYPRGPRLDYALYLRGLINFTRGGSIVDKIFPRNFSDLDGVRQKEAFHDFSTLITRHGGSPYAVDARKRMHYLKNTLGASEVNVAKHYMQRGAYLAAFNRADYAIKHHQGTPAIIDALQIKICAANKLGKKTLANDTMKVLKLNFPTKTKFKCVK